MSDKGWQEAIEELREAINEWSRQVLILTQNEISALVEAMEKCRVQTISTEMAGEAIREHLKLLSESQGENNNLSIVGKTLDGTKRIIELEQRRKRCKNYLELKQIDRELNVLKFRKRKKGK